MTSLDCGTVWRGARTGVGVCVFALLGGASVTATTAQTAAVTVAAGANAALQSSVDLYRTWQDMAGQVSQRLARANDRLPMGPVPGLTGKNSFVSDHMAVLEVSVKRLEEKANIPGAKLKIHQAQVLAFLNRATEIARLLNDLERSEAGGQADNAANLRKNIAALAGERLFAALEPSTPARLQTVWSSDELSGIFEPGAINRLKIAIDNTGDETAADITVTLLPSNALIASVSDGQGSCSSGDGNWQCRTATLDGGQQWPIEVTLRHLAPRQVAAGAPTRVGVSVTTQLAGRPPGKPATFSYEVANCRVNFSQAIVNIGSREGAALLAALKAAQSGAESLNGTWISRPQTTSGNQLNQVFNSATGIVEARGGDPWLTASKAGRAVARVINSLNLYLTQTKSAAQCSSAGQIVAADRQALKPLYQRMAQVTANRISALRAATATVANLERLAGISTPDTTPSNGVRTLLSRLEAALNPDAAPQPGANRSDEKPGSRGSNTPPFSRLVALSARLPDRPGEKGKAQLRSAKTALASIEASVYFELAEGRYKALRQSLEATFAALLVAQKATCLCKPGNVVVSSQKSSAPITAENSNTKQPRHRAGTARAARRVINPPSPRPKPVEYILRLIMARQPATRQPVGNALEAARRAMQKRRLRRLGSSAAQSE